MKKFLSVALLLSMLLGMLAGCQFITPESPAEATPLESAVAYLKNMYDKSTKDEDNKLTADKELLPGVTIDGVFYTVTWAIEITSGPADCIVIADGAAAGSKKIDIVNQPEEEVRFTLTGTVSDADGNTATIAIKFYSPAVEKVEVEDGKQVVIKIVADAKYATGTEYEYTSSSGSKKMEIVLSDTKADAVAFTLITNDDDSVSFKTADGYFLSCDGNNVEFVKTESDYTKFFLEAAEGGQYIKTNAIAYEKPQYLEVYSGYLTCYGMNAEKTNLYIFELEDAEGANGKVVKEGETTEPDDPGTGDEPETPSTETPDAATTAPFANGDKVVIVAGAYKKALSSNVAATHYLAGVDVTVANGAVSGYGDTEIWTVIVNDDGTYSFEYNGKKLSMQDSYNSVNLDYVNDKWNLYIFDNGAYALKNVVRGNFLEWYAEKNNWSSLPDTELSDLFQLNFYVVNGSTTPDDGGETPSTPTTSLKPVAQPEAGKAYKFVFQQNNLEGKLLGITGQMSGNFGSTTTNVADMVDVYLEASGNGFSVYYLNGETKVYLNMVVSGTYVNVGFQTLADNATPTVYTLNTDGKYIFTSVSGVDYYFGSYKTFETLSTSKTEYIVGDKASSIGVSNFCAWFYELAETTTPDDGGETPETPSTPETPAEPEELTVQEAINKGKAQAQSTYTTEKYYISGVISELSDASKGNFVICDDAGNLLTVYGSFNADGTVGYADMTEKPATGDTVKVLGIVGNYYGTPQVKDAWIVDYTLHTCSYNDATCTEASKCDKCGDVKANALGHTVSVGLCGNCGKTLGESVTASKTIADLITAEGWSSSTTKQSFKLDNVVSVQINGGSNTGKAYDGDHIRIYATDTPAGTITISVPDGYQLVSVKISTLTGTYAFLYVDGTTTDISNVSTAVSGASVKLTSVKNGSNGKQVRVTAMEVTYQTIG